MAAKTIFEGNDYEFDEIADFYDDSPNENEASVKEIIKSKGLIKPFSINEHIAVCTIPTSENSHPTAEMDM